MENLVFLELRRRGNELYFYSQRGCEVDFVIKKGIDVGRLIQVCYALDDRETKKREIRALLNASQKLYCKDLVIITWDTEGEEIVNSTKITIVPLWKWLLLQ